MAIKALSWMVRVFEPPVYCFHEIVHNRLVVDRFRELGVVFVDDVSSVPANAPLMLSAHGSAPEVVAAARANGRFVVDAVCPLVTKVHHEAKVRAAKGYTILYVGHHGHDEAEGTLAVAPDAIRLVESDEDLQRILPTIPDRSRVALLAQTTLAVHEWDGMMDRARDQLPDLWTAARGDLCYATTNRQGALRAIATDADAVVVIGSPNSSNTLALAMVADELCPIVLRIDEAHELDVDALDGKVVGVTAGASAPELIVQEVVARLAPVEGVTDVLATEEDDYFPPPRELREIMPALDRVAAFAVGGDPGAAVTAPGEFHDDRSVGAADVLAVRARPLESPVRPPACPPA
jgi:4-hydroxy-3-methylbut-2-enyl diphosphate reductase